ncbi:MAG: P-loop NTPase [Gaiellaceae bacterium]
MQTAVRDDNFRSEDHPPDGVSTLRYYLQPLWRRKWVFLAPVVVILLVTIVATLRQTAEYRASADVFVNRQELASTSLVGQTPALDNADRTMQTHARLARIPLVLERVLKAANAGQIATSTLRARSSVFPLADILRFQVSDEDPARAARLASAYAREFVAYRRGLDTLGLAPTLDRLRDQIEQLEADGNTGSPLYVRLADREQQLQSLQALRLSNLSVVRADRPGDATEIGSRPTRNAAIAIAAGLVVGLVLVFLFESLSTRPRRREEFEALLDGQYLGRQTLEDRGGAPLALDDAAGREADAAHALRASFDLANARLGARTIMVTSPGSGEGKSECALQLAVSLARSGRHVTLVDLDLRTTAITRLTGVDRHLGMTSVIRGECDLTAALVTIPLEDTATGRSHVDSNGRNAPGALLEIVGSGPPAAVHPAELLSSSQVATVFGDLENRSDVVLVDVPPLLEAPDAAALSACVDAILLVVGARAARGPTLAEARRAIAAWPPAMLGFVLTEGREGRTVVRGVPASPRSGTHASEPERVG